MANTVEDIDSQIKALQEEKTLLLSKKKAEVIANIRELIETYDITAKDLGLKSAKSKVKAKPMYANPDFPEQNWTGRGRQPEWVKGFISLHGSLDKALIK